MATNRTMEDWFLRGGEKPQENGMQAYVCGPTVAVAVCQNCGGENLATEEYCTHCGAPLVGEPSTAEICGQELCPECGHPLPSELDDPGCVCPRCGWAPSDDEDDEDDKREFTVTVRRTWTVLQEAKMKVIADCEESAMMKAEDIAEVDDDGEVDWDNVPDTDEYDDYEAISAEES